MPSIYQCVSSPHLWALSALPSPFLTCISLSQVYHNTALGPCQERCKELAAAFGNESFNEIRAGQAIAEYIGPAVWHQHVVWMKEQDPRLVAWMITLETHRWAINGVLTDVKGMAEKDGLASAANHATTDEEENAVIVRYDRHVSPITGRSPVIVLVAKKNIPASKRDGKDGEPAMVNIRWKYPGRALEAHHLTPQDDEGAPPAPDGGGRSAPKRAASPEGPGEPCQSDGS